MIDLIELILDERFVNIINGEAIHPDLDDPLADSFQCRDDNDEVSYRPFMGKKLINIEDLQRELDLWRREVQIYLYQLKGLTEEPLGTEDLDKIDEILQIRVPGSDLFFDR